MVEEPDATRLSDAQKHQIKEYIESIESIKNDRRAKLITMSVTILGVSGLAITTAAWSFIVGQARSAADLAVKVAIENKIGDIEKKRQDAIEAIINSRASTESAQLQAEDNLVRSKDLMKQLQDGRKLFAETIAKNDEADAALVAAQEKVKQLDIQVTENLKSSTTLTQRIAESSAFAEQVDQQVASIKKITQVVSSLNSAKQDIVNQIKSDPELFDKIAGNIVVPSGAIAAFDRSETEGACPVGWHLFEQAKGRVIVGAGSNTNKDVSGNDLAAYPALRDDPVKGVGGKEMHKLTVEQLPEQAIQIANLAAASRVDRYNAGGRDYPVVSVLSDGIRLGNGEPIPTMMPFVALYYCIKD